MRFEFATANRIIFGAGVLGEIGPAAAALGRRALVVTGRAVERSESLRARLVEQGVEHTVFSVGGEPSTETASQGTARAREAGCDMVIGFGGGSVLDAGKAIAALLTNGGDPLDYLEVIGRGQPLARPSAPMIAIPTTAGTGTEVTRNAVLSSPEHRVKVSLRSAFMLPTLALVDSELTYSLPPDITAYTGLDALTQLIEPFVSVKANPLTDALCREGIRRAARSLRRAVEQGGDPAAREDMAIASLFSGLALANAGLGAVHGFAGPFGGMFDAPHGAVCAALLPHVMGANLQALQARQSDSEALRRYDEIARLMTGDSRACAADGVAWIGALCDALRVPGLAAYGLDETGFDDVIARSAVASSMKGNPIVLTSGEMRGILEQAL